MAFEIINLLTYLLTYLLTTSSLARFIDCLVLKNEVDTDQISIQNNAD